MNHAVARSDAARKKNGATTAAQFREAALVVGEIIARASSSECVGLGCGCFCSWCQLAHMRAGFTSCDWELIAIIRPGDAA